MFSFESVVRDYHIYKEVWTSFVGELCTAKLKTKTYMTFMLLLSNEMVKLLAIYPDQYLATPCHLFLQRGGS